MNRITKYLTLAAALLALAGCNKELAPEGAELTVEASVSALTKVSADGGAFTSGDQIAVYAWLGGATEMPATRVVDGVVNAYDGTKWAPAMMMRWQVTDDPHYFLGVCPVPKAAIADFTAVPYTLDPTKYVESDLLLATTPDGVKNTGVAVPLAFQHAMAKLTVNLKFRSQWATTPDVSAVTVTAKSTANVNYLTQAVTATGTTSAVTVPEVTSIASGYDRSFSGLHVPQTGVRKVTVNIDGKDFVYEAGEDITLASGRNTTLNLLVGRDKIDLAGISLSPWTPEDPLDTGNAEQNMLFTPLTIEAAVAGAVVNFDICTQVATNPVYYRLCSGTSWTDWKAYVDNSDVTLANVGDKVQFKSDNAAFSAFDGFTYDFSRFKLSAACYVYGNVMSLIDSDHFNTCFTLTSDYALAFLFAGMTASQPVLFHDSKRLLLPAVTLTPYCYYGMFQLCTILTGLPDDFLPATTLAEGCYAHMFDSCYGLNSLPEGLLPAAKDGVGALAEECYYNMFQACDGLTALPAGLLPATTLASHCYDSMFSSCSYLQNSPVLPAPSLADCCYGSMFSDCTRLSSVTCLATDITDSSSTLRWLNGVAAAGTFTCPASMAGTWPQNSINGIPIGWTQVDYVAL